MFKNNLRFYTLFNHLGKTRLKTNKGSLQGTSLPHVVTLKYRDVRN